MSRSHPDNLPEPSPSRPERCNGGLFRADLKAHLDGEMSVVRHWLVRCHLAQCAECREELRWLRRLGEDMKDIESARPRPELRARIMANLPAAPPAPGIRVVHSRPDRERFSRLAPRLALASGFAMVFAFGAVFALTHTVQAPAGKQSMAQAARLDTSQGSKPMVVAVANPPAPEAMPEKPAEDPYGALADTMFQKEMAQRERTLQLERQDDWHRLMTQARSVARNSKATSNTEIGVSLAVTDVAGVRAHLPGWAKQEGVQLVMDGPPAPASAGGASAAPGALKPAPEGMVAFYVPAERGPAFLGALKQLGQISLMPLTPKATATSTVRTETNVQVEVNSDHKLKAIPTAPTPEAGVPIEKPTVASTKPVKAARYLVLTVLLQALPGSRP